MENDIRESSCKEFSEDNFNEGDYAFDGTRILKELWWPKDSNYDAYKFEEISKKEEIREEAQYKIE